MGMRSGNEEEVATMYNKDVLEEVGINIADFSCD